MKKNIAICSIFGLAISPGTFAASLDVDINNDTLRGEYNFSDRNADLGLSAALVLTDDRGEVGALTARTQGQLANQQFIRGGFGGRAYYASPDGGDSFQALGIGGYVDVTLPKFTDMTLGAEVYYAPSITITDDLDNLREIAFRASYQLFENATLYAGIRHLEVEVDDFDFEFTEDAHVGFTLQF